MGLAVADSPKYLLPIFCDVVVDPLLTIGLIIAAVVVVQFAWLGSPAINSLTRSRNFVSSDSQTQREQIAHRTGRIVKSPQYPTNGWRGQRQLNVQRIVQESDDCKSFVLSDPNDTPLPSFVPGQFIMVEADGVDGQAPKSRCYSLSAGPASGSYRITVKRVPGGAVSNWLHDHVREGQCIPVRSPAGRFVLDVKRDDLVVGIAAGVGITPMASMAQFLSERHPARQMVLFYSVRDGAHCPLIGELRQLERSNPNFTVVLLHSKPQATDTYDLPGRLSIDVIRQVIGQPVGSYYLCGPMEFMTLLSDELKSWGVPEDSVSFESFGGSAPAAQTSDDGTAKSYLVSLRKSGKKIAFKSTDASIVDSAESEGVQIETDCRAGACGTCLVKLLRGKVRYDQPPSFSPINDHECLACVARPESDVELDA